MKKRDTLTRKERKMKTPDKKLLEWFSPCLGVELFNYNHLFFWRFSLKNADKQECVVKN
jgi:hypothetical protein